MIKIVSFTICPFAQRVIAALEAKKIPYEIEYIDLSDKPEWFANLSPTGQVPVLIAVNGTVLHESDAIVEYIDDEYGVLREASNNQEKALERAWSYQAAKNYMVQCSAQRAGDKSTFEERSKSLLGVFDRIDKQLNNAPFFYGKQLSKVDVAWLPILHRAALIHERTGYDFIGNNPKVKEWKNSLLATGLADKSVATNFTEKFFNFYLSRQTYLGAGDSSVGGMDDVTGEMGDKG